MKCKNIHKVISIVLSLSLLSCLLMSCTGVKQYKLSKSELKQAELNADIKIRESIEKSSKRLNENNNIVKITDNKIKKIGNGEYLKTYELTVENNKFLDLSMQSQFELITYLSLAGTYVECVGVCLVSGKIDKIVLKANDDEYTILGDSIYRNGEIYYTSNVDNKTSDTPKQDTNTVNLYFGGDKIVCGTTKDNFNTFSKYSSSSNIEAINDMISAGQLFFVPSSTKALILDGGITVAKVKIKEGAYEDTTCWVYRECTE